MLLYINFYTFLIGISKAAYLALFNLLLKERGFDNSVIGNASFYYSWGIAFGGLFFSFFSDRLGRKSVLLLTMPLFALFGLLRLNVSDVGLLYTLSFLFGFVDTSIILPTISVIEHSDERKKLRNSNINFSIVMLTGVIGYLGAGLLSEKIGFINSLRVSMAIAILSMVPLFKIPNVKGGGKSVVFKVNVVQFTIFVYYILSGALISVAAAVFINFGNVIFFDLFSFTPALITLILTISQLLTAVMSIFSHKLSSKLRIKFAMFLFYAIVTILIFTMPVTLSNPIVFSSFYILRFVFLNITTPMFTVFCLSYLPKEFIATFSGLSYFTNNVMRAVAAQLFATLSKSGQTNYSKLFFTTGIFYLLNTILTLLAFFLVSKFSELNINKTFEFNFFNKKSMLSARMLKTRKSSRGRIGRIKSLKETTIFKFKRSGGREKVSIHMHIHKRP